jgi:hypothetical protein
LTEEFAMKMAFRTAIASAVIATLSTFTVGADKPTPVSQSQVAPPA